MMATQNDAKNKKNEYFIKATQARDGNTEVHDGLTMTTTTIEGDTNGSNGVRMDTLEWHSVDRDD